MVKNIVSIFGMFLFLVCAFVLFSFVASIAILVQTIRKVYRKEDLKKYFKACAVGEDQRAGSYLYGTEDYTVSSYTYYLYKYKKNKHAGRFMRIIDFFADKVFNDKEHCKTTYYKEKNELHNGGASFTSKSV